MRYVLVFLVCLVLVLAGCQPISVSAPAAPAATDAPAEEAGEEVTEGMSAEEKITNAMTAGPASISADAAVLDWPSEAGGELIELRAGTNDWTCFPDDPSTPANDPICADQVWLEWFKAVVAGTDPVVTSIGFSYMLQGGAVVDNNDPTAKPTDGQEWQIDPPHVMVVSPTPWDPALFTNDHHSGGPWVMFGGTPREHIMIPAEMPPLASEAGDDKIANALSAGPSSIAEGAGVLDWPTEAGGELVELRAGTNGWTCFPDDPSTPTNDPICADQVWLEWFKAVVAGTDPVVTSVGFSYMLQGGAVVDNNDPTAKAADGQEWQIDPPHFMVLSPEPWDPSIYSTDHHSGGAWVMFGGTAREHIMVPVTDPVHGH
jgi:hypothetical protein